MSKAVQPVVTERIVRHIVLLRGERVMLDVHLAEDTSRARKDNAPANIAMLKRLARNILQTTDDPKRRISQRTKACNWNDDYLIHALTHMR